MSRYGIRCLTWKSFSLSGPIHHTNAFGAWTIRRLPHKCLSLYLYFTCISRATAPRPFFHCPKYQSSLDDDLLLARIHAALGILCRHRDHVFSVRKRRREIVERPVISHQRHFPPVHHHPRARFCLPRHLNHMPVLNERIEVERKLHFLARSGNNRETVLFALHRLLTGPVKRLDRPVISALWQPGDDYTRRRHLAIQQ